MGYSAVLPIVQRVH